MRRYLTACSLAWILALGPFAFGITAKNGVQVGPRTTINGKTPNSAVNGQSVAATIVASGSALWLDADLPVYTSGTTQATDGQTATIWTDASGNSNTATGTATFKTSIINSRSVLRFNGTSDKFSFTDISLSGDFSLYVVGQSATDAFYLAAGTFATNEQILKTSYNGNVAGQFVIYNYFDNGGGTQSATSSSLSTSPSSFGIWEIHRSGSTLSFFENGTARGTGTNTATFTLNRLMVVVNVVFTAGDIGTVLVYTSLNDSTKRAQNRTYLGTKYGITVTP